jgi:rare lipoprotein A (peptidoglycan hydrolase)
MNKTSIRFTLILAFIFAGVVAMRPVKAEIQELPLAQGNMPVTFSQGIQASIINTDTSRVFLEILADEKQLYINAFPLDSKINYRLSITDPALLSANPTLRAHSGSMTTDQHRLVLQRNSNGVIPVETTVAQPIVPQSAARSTSDVAVTPTSLKKFRTVGEIVLSSDSAVDSVTAEVNMREYDNAGLTQITKAYDVSNPHKLSLTGVLRYTYNGSGTQTAYQFDYDTLSWLQLPTYNDIKNHQVYFTTSAAYGAIAIFNSAKSSDGIASWYDQSRYKSFSYKGGNFAASRDYSKGTKLKVTRNKTGASVIITVNDYGPELRTGRILDLDKQAFQQLASTGAGEIYVTIEKIDG